MTPGAAAPPPAAASPAAGLLEAVLAGTGRSLLSAQLRSLDPVPGGELEGYEVVARDAQGVEEGHLLYVEPAGRGDAAPGVLRAEGDGAAYDVWAYPRDPALPALPAAAHPEGARVLLGRLGVELDSLPETATVSYRPHRRAAVRVRAGGMTVYLKVVPPAAARSIYERHARWAEHGIAVPRALGWSPEGLVALDRLPGSPLAAELPRLDDADALAAAVDELRERIAGVPETGPARRSLAARADWYRRRLERRHPELAERLAALAARIQRVAGAAEATTSIHGDLHVGQLFLGGPGEPLAVLDLDTGGRGDPADDDAALWAHLVATAYRSARDGDGGRSAAALGLAAALHPRRSADEARIARALAIAAAQLLGHALTGAIPAEDAVAIAEQAVARPDEKPLIPVSTPSHGGAGA